MDYINELMKIDIMGWIIGGILILTVIKFCIELFDSLLNRFGITTKKSIKKHELELRVQKLEKHDKEQYQQLNDVAKGILDIKEMIIINEENILKSEKEQDIRRIKDLKSEILSFSRSLKKFDSDSMSDDFDEEDYNHIFEAFEEYEKLLSKHCLTNGKTIRAMSTINMHSKKHGYGEAKL